MRYSPDMSLKTVYDLMENPETADNISKDQSEFDIPDPLDLMDEISKDQSNPNPNPIKRMDKVSSIKQVTYPEPAIEPTLEPVKLIPVKKAQGQDTRSKDQGNESRKVGAPLRFNTPEEIEEIGVKYIEERTRDSKPLTITGLALALGIDRKALMEYGDRSTFGPTIKKFRSYCEDFAEQSMYMLRNPAGPIFALKNFGWTDKVEISGSIGTYETADPEALEIAKQFLESQMKK